MLMTWFDGKPPFPSALVTVTYRALLASRTTKPPFRFRIHLFPKRSTSISRSSVCGPAPKDSHKPLARRTTTGRAAPKLLIHKSPRLSISIPLTRTVAVVPCCACKEELVASNITAESPSTMATPRPQVDSHTLPIRFGSGKAPITSYKLPTPCTVSRFRAFQRLT